MASELWIRNPLHSIREVIECGESNICFDYGFIIKRKVKPRAWAARYFQGAPYRMIIVGSQGSPEFNHDSQYVKAVYPTWVYGQPLADLEMMMVENAGTVEAKCQDPYKATDVTKPVFGQEHRVIVSDLPNMVTGLGKRLLSQFKEFQEEYPDCILHTHGLETYLPFGLGIRSSDLEIRMRSQKGQIVLPTGKYLSKDEDWTRFEDWIKILGFTIPPLHAEGRERCMFNIKSARWASKYFATDHRFKKHGNKTGPLDITSPDADYDPAVNQQRFFGRIDSKPGDRYTCDSCSLAPACKYAREGSVCTLPGSEPEDLASFFGTRNASTIIDGLGKLAQIGVRRFEQGLEMEEDHGLDPEVTKIGKQLFEQGERLAKLIDPALRNPKVAIQVNNNNGAGVDGPDPRTVIARAMAELERRGFSRDQITPELLQGVLQDGQPRRPQPIEGTVVRVEDRDPGQAPVVPMPDLPF